MAVKEYRGLAADEEFCRAARRVEDARRDHASAMSAERAEGRKEERAEGQAERAKMQGEIKRKDAEINRLKAELGERR